MIHRSNYASWANVVKMWCMGQGLQGYFIESEKTERDKDDWLKIGTLLCSILWQLIDPSLYPIFTNFTNCNDLWT